MTFDEFINQQKIFLRRRISFEGGDTIEYTATDGKSPPVTLSMMLEGLETDNEIGQFLKKEIKLLNEDFIKKGKSPIYE